MTAYPGAAAPDEVKRCNCGAYTARGELPDGRAYYRCSKCRSISEPWSTESGAIARWNRSVSDVECIGCAGLPRMTYTKSNKFWVLACCQCGYSSPGALSMDGALSAWSRNNRKGSAHSMERWKGR